MSPGRQLNGCHLPQPGDQSKVEVEDILEPLDGGGGLVGQNLDEIRAGPVSRGLEGIIVELLDAVGDASFDLCAGEGTVDTRGGLGRVSTEESCAKSSGQRSNHPSRARETFTASHG